MALRLLVLTAALDPPPQVLIKGRRANIGRSADAHVRLPDPSVSKVHASIIKRGDNYLLIDEGSRHGTAVGMGDQPVWLAPESPRILQDGEHIWIGQIELKVELVAAKRGEATGQEELAQILVQAGLQAAGIPLSESLVENTLQELTDLDIDDFDIAEPGDDETSSEPVGVAALAHEDQHPPWKTDLFVALIAVAIIIACAFALWKFL